MQEPESTAKFNEGQLKELTGADKMITRELFKGCVEFVPQYKPIICCNTVPTINAGDGGTQRRIVIVPFELTLTRFTFPLLAFQAIGPPAESTACTNGVFAFNLIFPGEVTWPTTLTFIVLGDKLASAIFRV